LHRKELGPTIFYLGSKLLTDEESQHLEKVENNSWSSKSADDVGTTSSILYESPLKIVLTKVGFVGAGMVNE